MCDEEFDYIVVGAGSAGCVLAGRLSQRPAPPTGPWGSPCRSATARRCGTRPTTGASAPTPTRTCMAAASTGRAARRWAAPARSTGSSTSVASARTTTTGPRSATRAGATTMCCPTSSAPKATTTPQTPRTPAPRRPAGTRRGEPAGPGGAGPLRVSDIAARHDLIEAFIAGAQQPGVPRTRDFNGATQEGAGYSQLPPPEGWRCSPATAYLTPAKRRPNLRMLTGALACTLVFEGRRAVGVSYRQGGRIKTARCRAELLLSAGAIQSPQLLQLSGIGPRALLERSGLPVVHELPGVGENLQDHLLIRLGYECTKPITTNDQLNGWFGRLGMGLAWLLRRAGPLAVGINQGGCFMRAPKEANRQPAAARPDIQFHVATLSADMAGGKVHPYSGFTMSVCQLRPESRGHVRIRSPDAAEPPAIQPNYLATALDRATTVAGVQAARAIAETPALAPYVKREVQPGPQAASAAELLVFCRPPGATIFHPVGPCRMGNDPLAVVDARLRVHGIAGLRVIDGSAMPTLVSGNTNAPIVMMAEKAVDLIRQDARAL